VLLHVHAATGVVRCASVKIPWTVGGMPQTKAVTSTIDHLFTCLVDRENDSWNAWECVRDARACQEPSGGQEEQGNIFLLPSVPPPLQRVTNLCKVPGLFMGGNLWRAIRPRTFINDQCINGFLAAMAIQQGEQMQKAVCSDIERGAGSAYFFSTHFAEKLVGIDHSSSGAGRKRKLPLYCAQYKFEHFLERFTEHSYRDKQGLKLQQWLKGQSQCIRRCNTATKI